MAKIYHDTRTRRTLDTTTYTVKNIRRDVWRNFSERREVEGLSVKDVMAALVEGYANGSISLGTMR